MAKRTDSKVDRKRKLEELKRQQRAKERRKTLIVVVAATVAGIALVGSVVGLSIRESQAKKAEERKVEAEAKAKVAAARAELVTLGVKAADAGCSPIEDDKPIPEGSKHVEEGEKVDYKTVPPTGGEHAGRTLPLEPNFFDMGSPDEQTELAVHDLEHGVIVAWYDKKLPPAEVEVLKKIAANTQTQTASATEREDLRRFLVLPWQRGDLPKPLYLTAWGHKQGCGKASGEAVEQFIQKFGENRGDAPEGGAPV